MREPRNHGGNAPAPVRSRDAQAPSAARASVTLATMAICGGCGDGLGDPAVIRQTPEEGHLWDTDDPNAAAAPRGVIVASAVVGALVFGHLVIGRLRRARRATRPGTTFVAGPIRISPVRRVLILDGNGLTSCGHRAGEGRSIETQFPRWMSDRGLLATVERIANDPVAYKSGVVPTGGGRYVAAARLAGKDGDDVAVKIIVEPDGEGVLAAHPSGVASARGDVSRDADGATTTRGRVREALERARAALPPAAADYATENPDHPDSIGTLACYEELLRQGELEVALYALVEVARGPDAGPSCGAALDAAAALLNLRRKRRTRRQRRALDRNSG